MAKNKSKNSDSYKYFGVPSNRRDSVDAGLIIQESAPRSTNGYSDTYRYFGVPSNRRDSLAEGLIDQGSTLGSANGYSDTYRYFGVPSTSSDISGNPVQYVEDQPINWVDITDTIPVSSSQQVPAAYGFTQPAPNAPVYAPIKSFGEILANAKGQPYTNELKNLGYQNRVAVLNDFVAARNNSRRYVQSMLNNSEYVPYEPPPLVLGRILDKYSRPADGPKPRISPVGLITEPVGYYK
jgi:hypothetical protein